MSAFEFFFTLLDLMLGLAVAVIIGGLSGLLLTKDEAPDWTPTPMLAVARTALLLAPGRAGRRSILRCGVWAGLALMSCNTSGEA